MASPLSTKQKSYTLVFILIIVMATYYASGFLFYFILFLAIVFYMTAFLKITKYEDMDREFFAKLKDQLLRDKYVKALKSWNGKFEARIIAEAERGRSRNLKLEENLKIIQEELQKE